MIDLIIQVYHALVVIGFTLFVVAIAGLLLYWAYQRLTHK